MKIMKVFFLLIWFSLTSYYCCYSKNNFLLEFSLNPKVCINSISGLQLGYNSPTGGNNSHDNKSSLTLTSDYSIYLKYSINNKINLYTGFGTSFVKQNFGVQGASFKNNYYKVNKKYFFQRIPIGAEIRLDKTKNSIFIGFGFDLVFDFLKNTIIKEGDLKVKNNENSNLYKGQYVYYINNINWSTFNPIIHMKIGYNKYLSKKLNFITSIELKQGFKSQINSTVYFSESSINNQNISRDHEFSSNIGQSINLNLGLEYKF
jgi:hypothetical protein